MLETIQIETGKNPKASVIWMHGLGADANDFVPIVPELNLPADISVRFVFPHAPMQPVSINAGFVMRAWYDVRYADFSYREDLDGIQRSQKAIGELIDTEMQRGIQPRHIVLAGFSQGAAMSLYAGLRFPQRLAGIMALSGYLPLPLTMIDEITTVNADIPIFMAHGTADPIVPLPLALSSKEHLARAGYQVEWHQYSMAHSVCPEEMDDIGEWLVHVLQTA